MKSQLDWYIELDMVLHIHLYVDLDIESYMEPYMIFFQI